MIRVIFIFLILLASVFTGIQLQKDPGYLLIALNQWTVETTLWVALFALLLLFILVHLLLSALTHLTHSPGKFRSWWRNRKIRKAQSVTRKGLIEFSEGYWQEARNNLIKALPNAETPLLNYLTAARAAQNLGENQLRDQYLREAQQSMPEAKIAVELTQAELQLTNHQWEQALATLRHLHDLAPKHPYVLKLLASLYQEINDWPQLLNLLPALKKYKVLTPAQWEKLQETAFQKQLSDLIKAGQDQIIKNFMAGLPRTLINQVDLVAVFVDYLLKTQQYKLAETQLRQALKKQYHDSLVTLYGLCPGNSEQLPFAESLLKKQPQSAALYLCLGRLCIQTHLWGKAKNYLETSIALTPNPQAYNELGKLHEYLNEPEQALHCFKLGIDLALVENYCG